MERKLYLDDLRPCPIGWDCVRSFDAFVAYIQEHGVPSVISFDHDLSFDHYPFNETNPTLNIPYDTYKEKTGFHCAKWLTEQNLPVNEIRVHSANPVGAENIRCLMVSWKRHCLEAGLTWKPKE
jgi:hypothetical protein